MSGEGMKKGRAHGYVCRKTGTRWVCCTFWGSDTVYSKDSEPQHVSHGQHKERGHLVSVGAVCTRADSGCTHPEEEAAITKRCTHWSMMDHKHSYLAHIVNFCTHTKGRICPSLSLHPGGRLCYSHESEALVLDIAVSMFKKKCTHPELHLLLTHPFRTLFIPIPMQLPTVDETIPCAWAGETESIELKVNIKTSFLSCFLVADVTSCFKFMPHWLPHSYILQPGIVSRMNPSSLSCSHHGTYFSPARENKAKTCGNPTREGLGRDVMLLSPRSGHQRWPRKSRDFQLWPPHCLVRWARLGV